MFSLFQNNTDMEHIRVYAVLDEVSEENKQKLRKIAQQFKRELVLVDAAPFKQKLNQWNMPMYRGSYATNYRLFFDKLISPDVEKLFYLDCDTLICGSLKDIVCQKMDDYVAAVVLDSLGVRYKEKILGLQKEAPYFNAGVLVIDVKNWQKFHITDCMLHHIQRVRSRYCNPDQDLLNIILQGKVLILGPEYNFQPVHRSYSDGAYDWVYGLAHYYTPAQLDFARKNPVILHAYRFLGQFPWHSANKHPDTPIFDYYLAKTPWKDYKKKTTSCNSMVFKIERALYSLLPKVLFLRLLETVQSFNFAKQNKEIQKQNNGRAIK